MQIILLPGNNPEENKDWIEELDLALQGDFDDTCTQYYRHWSDVTKKFDIDYELELLVDSAQVMDEYVIFAKSVGALLALKGIGEGKLEPKKNIFVGTSMYWADNADYELDNWLDALTMPTLFIQKTGDPAISFEKLKKRVEDSGAKDPKFIELPGDDHHYSNVQQLRTFILDFVYGPKR